MMLSDIPEDMHFHVPGRRREQPLNTQRATELFNHLAEFQTLQMGLISPRGPSNADLMQKCPEVRLDTGLEQSADDPKDLQTKLVKFKLDLINLHQVQRIEFRDCARDLVVPGC